MGILTGGIYLDLRSFIFFLVKLSQYAVSAENISKGLVKKVFAVFSGDCMTVDLESLYLKTSLCEKAEDKVLSLLEACFDLILGSSLHMKIQIMGGKITENPAGSRGQIPPLEGPIF